MARRSCQTRFTALLHYVDVETLKRAFYRRKRKVAPNLNKITVAAYEQDLTSNLRALHCCVQANQYRPKSKLRCYFHDSSTGNPPDLQILEDLIVQSAVAEVLNAVYEADFCTSSFGLRPGRRPRDALRTVHTAIVNEQVDWIVSADIQNFFASADHAWLERMLAHRIADPKILRLIRLWLQAGVMDSGAYGKTLVGLQQLAGIRPLLANIYLHYALDLWIAQWQRRESKGHSRLIRFVDSCLLLIERRDDALQLYATLSERISKFNLELVEGKPILTRLEAPAGPNGQRREARWLNVFEFLGLTYYVGRTRKGRFLVRRKTQLSKSIRIWQGDSWWHNVVVRAHYACFCTIGNTTNASRFKYRVMRCWQWLLCQIWPRITLL